MKNYYYLFLVVCFLASCAAMPGGREKLTTDHLCAQNRLMKNQLNLAVRENEVLKEENLHYKSELNNLNQTISKLQCDIESLNVRYNDDMAKRDGLYENLRTQFNLLENESEEKIKKLNGRF